MVRKSDPAVALLHGALFLSAVFVFATPLGTTPILIGLVPVVLWLIGHDDQPAIRAVIRRSLLIAVPFAALLLMPAAASLPAPPLHWKVGGTVLLFLLAAPFVLRAGRVASRFVPLGTAIGPLALWCSALAVLIAWEATHPGLKEMLFGWAEVSTDVLRLNRPAEYVITLLAFAAAIAWRLDRRALFAVTVLAAALLAACTTSESARLVAAVCLPLAVMPIGLQNKAMVATVAGFILLGLLALTPFYSGLLSAAEATGAAAFRPETFAARLDIWARVADLVASHPFGLGMEATRALAGLVDFSGGYYADPILWHPHNAPLQIALDLGWAGIAATTALGLWLLRLTAARKGAASSGVRVLFVAAVLQNLFAHSAWQSWYWSALLIFLFMAGWRTEPAQDPASRRS